MRVEIGGVAEGLLADGALVGRGRAVGRLVLLQVGLLSETLVTNEALERTLAWRREMTLQVVSLTLH